LSSQINCQRSKRKTLPTPTSICPSKISLQPNSKPNRHWRKNWITIFLKSPAVDRVRLISLLRFIHHPNLQNQSSLSLSYSSTPSNTLNGILAPFSFIFPLVRLSFNPRENQQELFTNPGIMSSWERQTVWEESRKKKLLIKLWII